MIAIKHPLAIKDPFLATDEAKILLFQKNLE